MHYAKFPTDEEIGEWWLMRLHEVAGLTPEGNQASAIPEAEASSMSKAIHAWVAHFRSDISS